MTLKCAAPTCPGYLHPESHECDACGPTAKAKAPPTGLAVCGIHGCEGRVHPTTGICSVCEQPHTGPLAPPPPVHTWPLCDKCGLPVKGLPFEVTCACAELTTTAARVSLGAPKHSHYFKDVKHLNTIDVYRVLQLFGVTDQAVGHAIKKLLCSGKRGTKDDAKDLREAIDSINRALEIRAEDISQ